MNQLGRCAASCQPKVIVDLQKTPLISGAGLELLLDARDYAEGHGGSVKLLGPNPICNDLLRISGLCHEFDVFPDIKSAIGSFLS